MTTLETLLTDPDTSGTWALLPDKSTIGFKIKNMWGVVPVKGKFTEFTGTGQLTARGAVNGRIDIQVASLRTGIGRRDKHLRSADFFDAERFPTITVAVTALHPESGNAAELTSEFTIKGITEPVALPVRVTEHDDGSVTISGRGDIDRTRFNLHWNKLGVMATTVTVSAEAVFVRSPIGA
ncbi:YceI family protein [Mycobacterium vicinigordonae]|uniref:YceI family protein n=1 Tax=Mycobacterium vicinigordonae TaxID=1719132 RepID=A0A7D6E1C8_9MYCO|nr:YceI family protein [Mycobacterium vicinigordonae]QLL08689.1 YceI family protein [Mycobacterium vicinigordonae]